MLLVIFKPIYFLCGFVRSRINLSIVLVDLPLDTYCLMPVGR